MKMMEFATAANTVGDQQGGIEEAERLLGYKVIPNAEPHRPNAWRRWLKGGHGLEQVPILRQGPCVTPGPRGPRSRSTVHALMPCAGPTTTAAASTLDPC